EVEYAQSGHVGQQDVAGEAVDQLRPAAVEIHWTGGAGRGRDALGRAGRGGWGRADAGPQVDRALESSEPHGPALGPGRIRLLRCPAHGAPGTPLPAGPAASRPAAPG